VLFGVLAPELAVAEALPLCATGAGFPPPPLMATTAATTPATTTAPAPTPTYKPVRLRFGGAAPKNGGAAPYGG
jgi:hypothetical protein